MSGAAFVPRGFFGATSGLQIGNGTAQSWNSWRLAPTTDARLIRRVRVENCCIKLWLGFTRAAAALVDSAPCDKTEAAVCPAVAGPVVIVSTSGPMAALMRWLFRAIPARLRRLAAITAGGFLGQNEAVVYIPSGLRTRCRPCPIINIHHAGRSPPPPPPPGGPGGPQVWPSFFSFCTWEPPLFFFPRPRFPLASKAGDVKLGCRWTSHFDVPR